MMQTAVPTQPPLDHPAILAGRRWPTSLRWFFAEFLVVVAGILVALAVSAWAQERQDANREQVYLRQLNADLLASESELAEARTYLGLRAEASARVLHRFWRDDVVGDDALRDDLSLPRSTRRFRPNLGTAEALTSSGDLGLIRSDALRADIVAYVESMKTFLEDISRYDETYYRPAVAMLYRGPDLYEFARFSNPADSMLPRPSTIERVPFPSVMADMVRDRTVYDGYNFLLIVHRNQSNAYGDMLAETAALRAKVDAAIR